MLFRMFHDVLAVLWTIYYNPNSTIKKNASRI